MNEKRYEILEKLKGSTKESPIMLNEKFKSGDYLADYMYLAFYGFISSNEKGEFLLEKGNEASAGVNQEVGFDVA